MSPLKDILRGASFENSFYDSWFVSRAQDRLPPEWVPSILGTGSKASDLDAPMWVTGYADGGGGGSGTPKLFLFALPSVQPKDGYPQKTQCGILQSREVRTVPRRDSATSDSDLKLVGGHPFRKLGHWTIALLVLRPVRAQCGGVLWIREPPKMAASCGCHFDTTKKRGGPSNKYRPTFAFFRFHRPTDRPQVCLACLA